jgi:hypothetical protein
LSNTKNKNPCAKPEEPLTEKETSKYYDLDTFDENILIRNREMKESLQSEENIFSQDNNSDSNGDQGYMDEEDENDEASIKDLPIESEDESDIDSKMEEAASCSYNQSFGTKINHEKNNDQNSIEGIYYISSNAISIKTSNNIHFAM